MWSTLTKNQELAQYISLFCLMLHETLIDEFVKSLRHPPPPSCWLRWLRQLLTPHCWQYGEVLGGKTYLDPASPFLCTSCLIDFPWNDPVYHCQQCGNRSAEPNCLRCHECLEDVQNIDESRSGFVYNEIVRDWILQLKFFVQYHLSSLLGRLLALSFQNRTWLVKFDSLVPIPLHSSRLSKRGFSQSLLLAHHLRKNLGEPAPEINPH